MVFIIHLFTFCLCFFSSVFSDIHLHLQGYRKNQHSYTDYLPYLYRDSLPCESASQPEIQTQAENPSADRIGCGEISIFLTEIF